MDPTREAISNLRQKTGAGLEECRHALIMADNDPKIAEGRLRHEGIALNIRPLNGELPSEAKERWIREKAQEWAKNNP